MTYGMIISNVKVPNFGSFFCCAVVVIIVVVVATIIIILLVFVCLACFSPMIYG